MELRRPVGADGDFLLGSEKDAVRQLGRQGETGRSPLSLSPQRQGDPTFPLANKGEASFPLASKGEAGFPLGRDGEPTLPLGDVVLLETLLTGRGWEAGG